MNENRHILVVDDNEAIHLDFRKVLSAIPSTLKNVDAAAAALFNEEQSDVRYQSGFEIDSAYQGQEGIDLFQRAYEQGKRYAMAFVDVRMPPGLDGIETSKRLWEIDAELQIVLCTAYSDYSWSDMFHSLGESDRLLILKKPFESVEVFQMAMALSSKWALLQQSRRSMEDLQQIVNDRTKELRQTNESLCREIEVRDASERALRKAEARTDAVLDVVAEGIQREQLLTATVENEIALESRAKLAAMVEFSEDAIISETLDGCIVSWNQSAERMYGYSAEEALGRTISFLIPPEQADQIQQIRAAVRQGEPCRHFDTEFIRKDGRRIEISLSVSPIKNQEGIVIGISKIGRDIRARKRVEQALSKSQKRLELAVRGSSDGLGDWSLLTNEAYWTPRLREMLGYGGDAGDEFENNFDAIASRMHPDDRDRIIGEINGAVQQHKVSQAEFRLRTRSGEYLWVQGRGRAVYDDAGTPYHFAGALTDISERKQMEETLAKRDEQLRQSQKLEAVGSLAGGIAHEFNNLLQAIRGYTKYAMEGLQADDQRHQDLEQVIKAADRAATLTRELLGFSRRQVLQHVNLDPRELVTDLVKMLRPLIGERIDLELSLATDADSMYADPGLLQQMLLNLCINARDAMPTGGHLVLKTQRVDLSDKYCELHPPAKPGAYVVFSVADTGLGMSPDVRERIFEPFFTTKEVGKGTGLGLAMVYGCVQQHGGIINVYSEPNRGTTFKIYLPIAAGVEPATDERPTDSAIGGKETILIAEDESMVRDLAVRILKGAGYSVLVAADGAEAVELFEANADDVSLALLDAVMPKLTGHQAYDRMKLKNPNLSVVFCSGYDPETGQIQLLMDQGVRMVQKPFDPNALLRIVREALDVPHLLKASLNK